MEDFIIYHNPRCSKSRKTLDLMRQEGIEPKILLYLDNPPSKDKLREVIENLGISSRDLLRKKEEEYKKYNLSDETISDNDLLSYMVNSPKLIERPIVIKGNKVIIGRPPENIYKLIKKSK